MRLNYVTATGLADVVGSALPVRLGGLGIVIPVEAVD